MNGPQRIVLASSSASRKALLARLQFRFETASPDIDESRRAGETPAALAGRLAIEKAQAVAARFPDALVIGSDQVATLAHEVLGKPGSHERAVEQLTACSGQRVTFLNGLALLHAGSGRLQSDVVPTHVVFRTLSAAQIERYLRAERPYDSAGSFHAEALGIALFERREGEDPTALIGLPLIRLVAMLEAEGVQVP
jgi:MAF protein